MALDSCLHFGHTRQFKLYEVSGGNITSTQVVDTNGSGHGALAVFLMSHRVDTVICGGIGGAQAALAGADIRLYGGVSGEVDAAVAALLAGSLGYDPAVRCGHHEQAGGHACGDHGCGRHDCH